MVELGPEACGDGPDRSAAARPDGRAVSEQLNDLSLADLIDNALPTADVRDNISAALGLEMALANASEAVRVLVNPIASINLLGTQPGSGTGDEVQSSLIALRSQSPWSCSCSDNCALKSNILESSLLGCCSPVSPCRLTLIA